MRPRGRAAGPLRRVVGYVEVEVAPGQRVTEELYECGHHRPPKSDAYGETNAQRRRCRQCEKEGRP